MELAGAQSLRLGDVSLDFKLGAGELAASLFLPAFSKRKAQVDCSNQRFVEAQ